MKEIAVQTRLPADLFEKVDSLAKAEGDSIAAWLRRLVIERVRALHVRAWLVRPDADPWAWQAKARGHDYELEFIRDVTPLERVYAVCHGSGPRQGRYMSLETYRENSLADLEGDRIVVLDGSGLRWKVIDSQADIAQERVEIYLRAQARVRPEVLRAADEIMSVHAETFDKLAR